MQTLSSDFERTLRRLKSDSRRQQLKRRDETELPFIGVKMGLPRTLLYDTTVYVDILQGRFPVEHEAMLRATDAWHSTVSEAELAFTCGFLNPENPGTRRVIREITAVIHRMSPYRTLAPDREIWREAGILTGTIARLQTLSKQDRHRILNDALIFTTARKFGHTVLTRNVEDFDFLHQLDPSGRVLFYKV
jgi:predicted nucleic acid-binding protein